MTKNNWWKYLCLCLVTFLLSGCSLLENLFFAKTEVPEFSFSGYVTADGLALEGATVDCGLSTTETNESGYFKFTGINKVVQVSVKKDGYLFSDDLVFVNSLSSDVNFRGYKLFDKSGVVKNNDVVVPNVEILAISENGEFKTMSNEYGEFYLTNLAGQVKITATKEGFNFFKSSFTIDKEDDVIISGLTNIAGRINVDVDDADIEDFTLRVNGEVLDIAEDFSFVANSVEPGAVFTLASEKYHIENNEMIVMSDLQDIVFECQKYYDVVGTIVCGDKTINDGKIVCGGKIIYTTNGTFKFENLYGENKIICSANGFDFVEEQVDAQNYNICMQGKTTISGKVNMDIGQNFDDISITFNNEKVVVDSLGKFTLRGVKFGQKLILNSENYFVAEEIVIGDSKNINISAYKLFDLNLSVSAEGSALEGADVTIGDTSYKTDNNGMLEVEDLYGEVNISVTKDGYRFEDNYVCNYFDSEKVISGYEYYSIAGVVRSGDIAISKGSVSVDNSVIELSETGTFEIGQLYGNKTIAISANGYNDKSVQISKDMENIQIDLSYNVEGIVLCGSKPLDGVMVFANNGSTKTSADGKFAIRGIVGSATISYSKNWYSFPQNSVENSQNLQVYGTYSLTGNVSKKKENEEGIEYLSNFKIVLINKTTNESAIAYTDDEGNYNFTGLNGEYALVYDMDSPLVLKPSMYDVTTGGNYDFSNNGYGFGGIITCGDIPLANVTLSIGNAQVTTDSDGKYAFPLVTKSGVITIEKEGYTFSPVGHNGSASDNFDGREDVNYSASYYVYGVIKSGKYCVAGVSVHIGEKTTTSDENGYFKIDRLTGENTISLALDNYKFDGTKKVSGYVTLEYVATFDVLARVVSGDVSVSGASLFVNGLDTGLDTNSLGQVTITNIQLGDIVSFDLNDYSIESKQLNEYVEDITLNSTYAIRGKVSNCGISLADVKVAIEDSDIYVMTNENGEFVFNGVVGKITISLSKSGFVFDNVVVSGAEYLNIMSKFDVEGIVLIGNSPLEGVLVTAGDHTVITDKLGKFKIIGLNSITLFTFEKTGYDFGDDYEISSPEYLYIYGNFQVKGKVKSGDLVLAGATITTNTGISVESDENGQFEITGLTGATTITIDMSGYNSKSFEVKEYTANLIANLDYDVVINFSGIDDYSGIVIVANTKRETCDSNTITLRGLKGETTITLSKDNCYFSPTENNVFKVDKGAIKNITITKLFSISGSVKTASGSPIAYAQVFAGKTSTTTDENGKYSFTGLSGEPTLKVVLPYNANGTYSKDLEITDISVKTDGVYNITVPDKTFAVNFLNYAYDNLRYSMSYQIFGSGKVTASPTGLGAVAGDQVQSVSVVYKQDAFGNKIFQNMNVGKKIDIAGVDPNVSLLSVFYTDANGERRVRYNQLKGEDYISKNNGNPEYSTSWTETDITSYKESFGVDYNGFSPYVINSSTVQTVSGLKFADGVYTFTLNLNCSEDAGAFRYYEKLMTVMCNKQELEFFSNISLTFTITNSGLLRQMIINESYQVQSSGFSAPTKANITYNFFINSLTEKIADIDISTPQTVQASILLGQETQVEMGSVQALNYKQEKNNIHCDIVSYKKEELL